jgi:tetratricopeptide (TPR) repeat protein
MKLKIIIILSLITICGSHALAQSKVKGQLQFTSTSPEAKILMRDAWIAMVDAKLDEAKELIAKAKEKDPSFAMPYLFSFSDTDEEYRENVRKAGTLKASADEKLLINAQLAFLDKQPTLAFYEPLIKKYPNDKQLQLLTALGMRNSNEEKRSLELLQALISKDPAFAAGYNLLGYAYMDMNELDKAREAFDKYISLRPDLANVYDSKGDYLMKAGKLDEAAEMFEKAAAMDPRNMGFSKNKAERARMRIKEEKIAEEIKPILKNLLVAVEERNAEKVFNFYNLSSEFQGFENGKPMNAKEFKENFTNILGTFSTIKFSGTESYLVINENAVVGNFAGSIKLRLNDGSFVSIDNFTMSLIFEKAKEEWKIVHSHESYPQK